MINKAHKDALPQVVAIKASVIKDDFTFIFNHKNLNEPVLQSSNATQHPLFYKLIWVREGLGSLFIDFTKHTLQAGQVFLMAPGQVYKWQDDTKFSGILSVFSEEIFDEFYHTKLVKVAGFFEPSGETKIIPVPDNKKALLTQLAQLLYSEANTEEYDLHIIRPLFMAFLTAFTCQENPKNTQPTKVNQLVELRNLIDNFYHKENSGRFYAQQLNISIKQLNILVKDGHGKTVSNLIQERILLAAKRSLILSHDSVKTIAYQLGFEDPSYFSRFFRRYMNCSPNQYRANLQQVNAL
ncbi:MAG: helix-turn-helix domain-containing protein [Bermanella sp.]